MTLKGHILPENDSLINTERFNDTNQVKISIEDVSLQDAESILIAENKFKLKRDDKFPIFYEIKYQLEKINPGSSINVRAEIIDTVNNQLLYLSTVHQELPDHKETGLYKLAVTKIEPYVSSNGNFFEFYFKFKSLYNIKLCV